MKTTTITKTVEHQPIAVAFYRVSTDKQTNDRQIEDVRKYCKAFDYKLVKEFKEVISGAANLKQRTELQALIKYVDEKKPEFIICSELSRLARSQDAVSIIKNWTDNNICFISLKENIKTLDVNGNKSPMTELLLNIMTAINIFELETIKYRVVSGLRKTVNNGNWSGAIPYGYNLQNSRLVINPNEAQTVKLMFEKYGENWGTVKIASHLNRTPITTKQGKTWNDTKVYKILSNPIYKGQRLWNKEPLEQPELRIIDDSTFANVLNRLTTKTNIEPINKHYKYDYLLTSKIICACGKHFIGQGRHNFYMCKSKKYSGGCNIKSINIDYIDTEVKKHLILKTKLLNDHQSIINKTVELQEELQHLQEKITSEKETQNYYINNIAKIGQLTFDLKFDASTGLVKQLQEQVDNINIKLSNNKSFMLMPPAIGIIDPNKEQELLNSKGKHLGMEIFSKVIIDKELVRKVIERIDIDNDKAVVTLINDSTFTINRP